VEQDENNRIEKVIYGEFKNGKRHNEENLNNIEKKFNEMRQKKYKELDNSVEQKE